MRRNVEEILRKHVPPLSQTDVETITAQIVEAFEKDEKMRKVASVEGRVKGGE